MKPEIKKKKKILNNKVHFPFHTNPKTLKPAKNSNFVLHYHQNNQFSKFD